MTIAQRLGFYTIDVGKVAGILTDDLLGDFLPQELSRTVATQYLRTRYMRLVALYGMPPAAVDAVAAHGWRLIAAAGGVSQEQEAFAFYE